MAIDAQQTLRRVARRQSLAVLGRTAFTWTCAIAAALAVAIVGGRLLGLWPEFFEVWMIAAVPCLAVLIGLITKPRPCLKKAARVTDAHLESEDLFLTDLQVDGAPGQFHPLVRRQAKAHAERVRPAEIVPLPFQRPALLACGALIAVWLAAIYLPQLDPFGAGSERLVLGQRSKRIAEERKVAKSRQELLNAKTLQARNSEEVHQALMETVKTMRKLGEKGAKAQDSALQKQQKKVGRQWRASREANRKGASANSSLQQLGRRAATGKAKNWQEDLQKGKTDALRQEIAELKKLAARLEQAKDPQERARIQQELANRTGELSEFLKQKVASQELSEALSRALNQVQALQESELSEEAMQALEESLALSDMELQELAQSLRNLEDLEEAMRALQAARAAAKGDVPGKKATAKGEGMGGQGGRGRGTPTLDTAGMSPAQALKAYRQYYEGLSQQDGGNRIGAGMQGDGGTGRGGIADEDPTQKTGYKPEQSRSSLRAGKILMTLKVQEVGDRGEVTQEYNDQLKKVQQGATEAILQERVPPGYHQGIKKYFDDLSKKPGKAKKK